MKKGKTIFITGTDTGVGKTLVSCLLLRQLQQRGFCANGYKPVASGAVLSADGEWRNEDGQALLINSSTQLAYQQVNPMVFANPVAPHIAAAQVGQVIDEQLLTQGAVQLASQSDYLIIEGAGGWHVPINDDYRLSDWVMKEGWPVVLVVGMRLGCLNHALLTYESLLASDLPLLGWVANCLSAEKEVISQNITYLQKRLSMMPLLGVIPYQKSSSDSEDCCYFPSITHFLD